MTEIAYKHLSQPWFDLIFDGKKTHEGRLNEGFWKTLQIGDKFIFWNNDHTHQEFMVEVIERSEFSTFESAINKIGLLNVLPTCANEGMTTHEAIQKVYFKYFTLEQESEHCIVMFKLHVC